MAQRGTWAASGPPEPRRSSVDWAYVALRLRNQPGMWLTLRDISTGMYSKVKAERTRPKALLDLGDGLEVALRETRVVPGRTKTRRGTLWLRWREPGSKPLIEHLKED